MKLKFTVISRVESLNQSGQVGCGVIMACTDNATPAKLELGMLSQNEMVNFPTGRVLEIVIPTYFNSKTNAVPDAPAPPEAN
jgi:hypothetical protein